MKIRRVIPGLLMMLILEMPAFAAGERAEFDVKLGGAIAKVNREAAADAEGPSRLAGLIQREYGTHPEELKWAVEKSLTWGEITAFAYIQATTGRSFETMARENAGRDFISYAESAGMSCDKMALSLDKFFKQAERERNSRIFEQLRASRRVHPLPDLGSGFGLFQEALDFRGIESPRPIKIHDESGTRTKD